ncbi:unnamed protein product [Soboliphyme baturini]|uniref:Yippee domain-containing protein n=1 Tax=Soboliphyme baturini TaxID=241478 RepID=A0A183ILF5_9BILA|nr:unnamed protein product [Soboliphyme baturini]
MPADKESGTVPGLHWCPVQGFGHFRRSRRLTRVVATIFHLRREDTEHNQGEHNNNDGQLENKQKNPVTSDYLCHRCSLLLEAPVSLRQVRTTNQVAISLSPTGNCDSRAYYSRSLIDTGQQPVCA